MKRRMLAIVCGLVGCGDDSTGVPVVDAPAPPIDAGVDAVPSDAFVDLSGLILHYQFEDTTTTIVDSSSRRKDGTVSTLAALGPGGRDGRGLALVPPASGPAATHYATLPGGVLTGVDDFTIALWVKYNSFADFARLYDIGNGPLGTGDRWMFMTMTGVGIRADSFGGSPTNEIIMQSDARFPTAVWKHIALTGTGGTRQLFIDGFPVARFTSAVVVPPKDMEPLAPASWIGRSRFEPPDPALNATLDDFRIYNRVLTQPQIADLANPKRDYAYWRFDETSGATAKDSSEHAIATALANGPTFVTGKLGGALSLPGGAAGPAGPHVVLSTSPLAGCTNQMTVATWVRLRALTPWSRIFDFGNLGNPDPERFIFLAPTDGAGMHFAMVGPNGAFDMVAPSAPIAGDDTWHHVAVTVNPAKHVVMYVDGNVFFEADNPTNTTPGDFAATTSNWLGRSKFQDAYLNGSLDDMRIACRAFTADEIKNLSRP
jgi:Concanavalin A-like lectin/glucanases superfamily